MKKELILIVALCFILIIGVLTSLSKINFSNFRCETSEVKIYKFNAGVSCGRNDLRAFTEFNEMPRSFFSSAPLHCIFIRPFSQLFDGCSNSTADDDQNGFELFKFRCAVIHDRERCSASRLHYYPVIGKES